MRESVRESGVRQRQRERERVRERERREREREIDKKVTNLRHWCMSDEDKV